MFKRRKTGSRPTGFAGGIALWTSRLPFLLVGWLFVAIGAAAECPPPQGVAVQILGSGGPIADDERASSGFVVWHDGRARVLVDAGGGTFLRFGQAGARLEDLDLIAMTHFHTDHASDLSALLKSGYFSPRQRALTISGPDGNHLMPGLESFLARQFDAERGSFSYLSGFLDGSGNPFDLEPVEVAADTGDPVMVWQKEGLEVSAVGVHHGPIPTLSYRIELDGRHIAIGGDQNLETGHFAPLAANADVLIMPMAIPEDAGSVAANLHARPSAIARLVAEAEPGHLVLSHLMARSLRNLDAQLERIRGHYSGRLTVAEDLSCHVVEASR